MKYLLFGTGDYYERYKKWFSREDVLALMDNAQTKQGTRIDGIQVLSPEDAIHLPYDRIVILSFYFVEMKEQLLSMGVQEDRIFHFYDLPKLVPKDMPKREIRYWECISTVPDVTTDKTMHGTMTEQHDGVYDRGKRMLLLSHDLSLGGPALALMHAAIVLIDHGYDVLYASMIDGALRELLLKAGISVVVDENLQWETMAEARWMKPFDLIICNTINYHAFLTERMKDIPVIWWLHDSAFFYGGVDKTLLRRLDTSHMKVLSVGPVPGNAMKKYCPDMQIGELLYGVSFG